MNFDFGIIFVVFLLLLMFVVVIVTYHIMTYSCLPFRVVVALQRLGSGSTNVSVVVCLVLTVVK